MAKFLAVNEGFDVIISGALTTVVAGRRRRQNSSEHFDRTRLRYRTFANSASSAIFVPVAINWHDNE